MTRFYRPKADIASKEKTKQVTFSQPEVNIEDKVEQLEKMITHKFGKEQDIMKETIANLEKKLKILRLIIIIAPLQMKIAWDIGFT